MFESDDLILRKNEKNFLLCLLEIARYGSQFGVSVPAIIKLEDEIEREIQRDKQTEIMSFTELRRQQRDEQQQQKIQSNSGSHGKYSKLLKLVRHEHREPTHHEPSKNFYNTFSLSHSNGANWLRQRISRIPKLTHGDRKKQYSGEDSNDSTTYTDSKTATMLSQQDSQVSRTLNADDRKSEPATSLSQLHKTVSSLRSLPRDMHISLLLQVVQMTDSCCCAQRFPVIRIGEGKYRIGENGTIIFIRVHRELGAWLELFVFYLRFFDIMSWYGSVVVGIRLRTIWISTIHADEQAVSVWTILLASIRSTTCLAHQCVESSVRHTEVPILALPNSATSAGRAKAIPFGKSVTMKTEEYPLTKPAAYDANLTDAQLIITRDAHGRHHIGQITYQSEENLLNPPLSCPQHPHPPSPAPKAKSARGTGQITPLFPYNQQPSAIAEPDYSPYSIPTSINTRSSFTDPIHEVPSIRSYSPAQRTTIERTPPTANRSQRTADAPNSTIRESAIDNIDDYIRPSLRATEHDFDLGDIDDAMRTYPKSSNDDDLTNMDEDSLESCSGVIEEHTKSLTPSPILSSKRLSMSKVKPGGYCTALYLAQKRKETLFTYPRSTTLPNVTDAARTEDQRHQHLQPQRKTAADIFNRMPVQDISKLDRDSGFDEQDFRCERLHSGGEEDNSSLSSIRSARSSLTHSASSEIQNQIYRENKAYELRLQALDYTRTLNEQSVHDPRWNLPRNFNYPSTKTNEMIHPATHKYRKNIQSNYHVNPKDGR